jgi:uncharacterized protein (DUF362 family)
MRITRRDVLQGAAATALTRQFAFSAQVSSVSERTRLSMPGLFPGKVIGVEHAGSIVNNKYQTEPVKAMMRHGMKELTGKDWAESWKLMFQPGDRVGIKVNPVGKPHVISAPEVLHQIIDGLRTAGVRAQDIVVYDRYRKQFHDAGFHTWLPEGVRQSHAVEDYDNVQLDTKGYDLAHYVDFPLTLPGHDISEDNARRSYAANFITREVDKLINLCVLKDHQSAGVTLALKNLSHGLVNNVCRSHTTVTLNACNAFIPAVVQMPVIRNKTVLHILDGVKGLYHGGPGARPQFVWDHKTIYFATDPVAVDHVGWRVIDEKRQAVGMKILVEDKPDKFSTYVHRQPEHVEIAGAMGLGVWDWKKIQYKHHKLG